MSCKQQLPIGRQQESIMARLPYLLYSALGSSLYLLAVLLLPLMRILPVFSSKYRYRLAERFGSYFTREQKCQHLPCLWIHGASVGELQLALQLIDALAGQARIVVTSTTEQGHRLACSRLGKRALCLMAPLDLPRAVDRALAHIRPDIYVCLETELWPVLLAKAHKTGIPLLLLNGRLSQRSFARYQRIRFFMRSILQRFHTVAAISKEDGERFLALGVPRERLRICGNMKYDVKTPSAEEAEQRRKELRQNLDISDQVVWICGSTHNDEERQLLATYARLCQGLPLVWILAPRHLERTTEVEELLRGAGLSCERYSLLKSGEKKREQPVILIDTMGDLADLYACGDYLFCGGSLVDKGGHNLMEASRWGRPVYYGPYIKDAIDMAAALQRAGGGFQVRSAENLTEVILSHHYHPNTYRAACKAAASVSRAQQGALECQIKLIRPWLAIGKEKQPDAQHD